MGYHVNDNIVILGDLNFHLFIANNNKLIETMMLFYLVNIISKPTRTTAHSNTLLDPIVINDTMNDIYSDVLKITPYNQLSGTQIISTTHGMTGRNFFDVFLPIYLIFGF
jgi:hypothetical protein